MRIALCLHRFPAVSETFILRQITGLIDLGHDVTIYSERTPDLQSVVHPEFEKHDLRGRVIYLDTQMPAESGIWSMPVWPISGETWLPGAASAVRNFDRILNAVPTLQECLAAHPSLTIQVLDPDQYGDQARTLEALYHLYTLMQRPADYDVIHAHFGPTGNNFLFARVLWHAPFVVSFHGFDSTVVPRERGDDVYQRLFELADAVVVNGENMKRQLAALRCPAEKLQVLRYGLDLSENQGMNGERRSSEGMRILSVARLVEKKGLEYSIRAFAEMRTRHSRARYDIIGEGPLRKSLEALIRELGLTDSVTLHGAIDSAGVRKAMERADIFVLASVTGADGDQEGTPVSLLEAQACGIPVIATRHSGIPEIVSDDLSGYLVPERDVASLARRLIELVEHPETCRRMGDEGRRFVESNHDIRRLSKQLVSIYDDAIAAYRSKQPGEAR